MKPLVTILIPTYNRSHFIGEAIKSALDQTFADILVLVLDDCSPDATPAAVEGFRNDPRVKYVRHSQNVGIANNWKFGIAAVQSDYFCILHDDDTFEPDFVESLVEPLVCDNSLAVSFCDQWVMDERGNRLLTESRDASIGYWRHVLPKGRLADFAASVLIDHSLPAGAAIFRRSVVTPEFIDIRARGSIDMWLFYRCLKTGLGAYFVPERLMNYRRHASGMSVSMPFEMIEGHLFRYQEYLADSEIARFHPAIQGKLAEALEWQGMALLRSGRFSESRTSFRRAVKISPTPKAILGVILSYFRTGGKWVVEGLVRLRRLKSR